MREFVFYEKIGLKEFLSENGLMRIIPSTDSELVFQGPFHFSAKYKQGNSVVDSYNLRITVPREFPKALPVVVELDKKIPRDGKHHINQNDNTLCLGSPLRSQWVLSQYPSLNGFVEKLLVPFLYMISHQRKYGGNLLADELAHGNPGILNDYSNLLKLYSTQQIHNALKLLTIKRRIANKRPCPCGCGLRYGKCSYRNVLEKFRYISSKIWVHQQIQVIKGL